MPRRFSSISRLHVRSMRLWTRRFMIERAGILDRVVQFLIVVEPATNLSELLATYAELTRATSSMPPLRPIRSRLALRLPG